MEKNTSVFTARDAITCAIYNRANQTWCLGTFDGEIIVLDVFFRMVRRWKGHERVVWGLVFPSDGGLVSGSWDGFVKRWDLETGREEDPPSVVWARNLGGRDINALAELPDGRVAAGCQDSTVRVLDLGTGQEIQRSDGTSLVCRGHTHWVGAVISLGDLSAGSFASGSGEGTIRVWASEAEGGISSHGTPRQVVEVRNGVTSISLSPCGGLVAAGCRDGSVRLFRLPEVTSGQPQGWDTIWSMSVHTKWVNSVSFSPNGRFIASGSDDTTVKLLCTKTGVLQKTFEGHTLLVSSALFSQNGTKILSGSNDNTVRVWPLYPDLERQMASLIYGMKDNGSVLKNLYVRLIYSL